MKEKYRILHLEDVAMDAEIIKRELKKNDINFDYLQVDTETEYTDALKDFSPDVILCDHNLPSFNSFEALKVLKAKKLNIPFIVITATMTEDIAMAIVKEGADDYILKDRLKRLPHAVLNAIEKFRFEKERKQLVDEVFEKEASANNLLMQLSDKLLLATKVSGIGIWEYLLNENKFIADDILLSQYGISSAEFIGTYESWMQYIHPEDKERVEQGFKDALTNCSDFDIEFRVIWGDGTIHYINGIAVVQCDNTGKPSRLIGTNQEITERKNAERTKEFEKIDKEALINCTNDLIWSVSSDMKLVAANNAFYQAMQDATGVRFEPGTYLLTGDLFPMEFVIFWEQCYKRSLSGESFKEEIYLPPFNKRMASWTETGFNPIYKNNKIIGVACYTSDITERKFADEKIRQSEARLAEAQAIASIGNWETDLLTLKVIWSNETQKIFGAQKESTTTSHQNFLTFVHPDDVEKVNAAFAESLHNNAANIVEHRIIMPAGIVKFVEERWQIAKDDDGNPSRAVGTVQDITERKLAENKIKESEAKFRSYFENSMDGILLTVTDGQILSANPAACEIFQMTEEEICATGRYGLIDEKDPRGEALIKERQLTGKAKGELTFVRKDGSKFPGEISSVLFKDSYGQEKTSMILRDITIRKMAEDKLAATSDDLQHAVNDLNKIMNASLDVICAVDVKGNIIKVSAASEAVWGYKPSELVGKPIFDLVYHEDNEKTRKSADHVMAGNNVNHFENRYIHKDGSLVSIEWSTRWDAEDKIRYGIARNVTEKKKLEKALKGEQSRLNNLFSQAPTAMGALKGANHVFEIANPLYLDMIGKKNIIGKSVEQILPEVIEQGFIKILDRVFDTGETFTANEMLVKLNTSQSGNEELVDKYLNFIYQAYKNIENEIEGIFFFIIDVTEQVLSRKKIEESEKQYRQIVETAQEGIWVIDENNFTTFVNDKMSEIFEYDREEMIGKDIYTFMDDEGKRIAAVSMPKKKEGKVGQDYFKYISKSGKEIWTNISANPLFDSDGKYIGALAMITDISEKLKVEQKSKFKAELLNTIGQAVVATDLAGTINFWNKAAETIYGWTIDEAIGKNILDLTPAKQTQEQAAEIMEHLSKGNSWSGEFTVKHKNGRAFPAFVTDSPIYDQNKKLSGIIGVSSDISERKKIEAQIKESEQRYRTLFEQNLAGFYQSNAAGELINCNEAFANMLKYDSPEELLKVNAHELYFSNEDRTYFIQNVIEKKKLLNHEGVLKCKDGSALYFLENISEQQDSQTGLKFFDGILIDVTEKKLAELQLHESNERFKNVSKATSDAIWDWNLIDKTIYWGEGLQTIFGYNPKELKNDISSWQAHIHPQDYDRVMKKVYESVEGTDLNWADEYRYLKKDQTYATVSDRGFIIRDEHDKAVRMVGAMQDITEKKAMADLLDKATSLARIGGWELNLIKNMLLWSGFTSHLHEVEADFVPDLATGINFYKEGRNRDLITLKMQEAIENGTPWDEELQIITAKGNERWVRCIGHSEIIDGKCIKLFGSFQDIDERKLAELSALAVLNEKNTILESIGDGFFAVDKNWTVTYWNNQAEKLLKTSKEITLGHNLWEIFSDSTESESYKKYHEAIETNKVINFEDYYPTLNKWYEISAYPSNNALAVYFKDVTERKNSDIQLNTLNKNLQKQARELTQSNEELEQFAYVASHDLQEPLRMVSSFLTLLERKYGNIIDDTGKKYIDFAVDGARRMRQIILDLLEFSRASRIEHERENVDVNKVVDGIKALLRKQMEDKNAVFLVDKLPVISSYEPPVRQIFQNLISNALKYSHKDIPCRIQISVSKLQANWQFAIKDNGIGIGEEYFDKIFLIFQRLHSKAEFSGTGLGLAVTKKLIDNLGGKIWVESEEGKGSTFYFTLPKN